MSVVLHVFTMAQQASTSKPAITTKANPWIGWGTIAVLVVLGRKAFRRIRGAPQRLHNRIANEVRAENAATGGMAGAGARVDLGGVSLNLTVGTDERGRLVVVNGDGTPATVDDLPAESDPGAITVQGRDARADRACEPLPLAAGVLSAGSVRRRINAVRSAARTHDAGGPGGRNLHGPNPADVTA